MQIEVLADVQEVAIAAACLVAKRARQAVAARGHFVAALSGGSTPWKMLAELAKQDVPWDKLHIAQVDERVAPAGDADRNLTHLYQSLLDHTPIPREQIHAMPVEDDDLPAACVRYAETLAGIAGTPPVLDLVHLGLGPDGHTASLVPEDAVLEVDDVDVSRAGPYQGRMRMTLTYPIINRAREVLWLITGDNKTPMLNRLKAADRQIPAGRVTQANAVVFADQAASGAPRRPTM